MKAVHKAHRVLIVVLADLDLVHLARVTRDPLHLQKQFSDLPRHHNGRASVLQHSRGDERLEQLRGMRASGVLAPAEARVAQLR